MTMDTPVRNNLIEQLSASFDKMPRWAKVAAKHALGAPEVSRATGKPYVTFREVLQDASDHTLETLRSDFEDNGDLVPMEEVEKLQQEAKAS